MDRRCKVMGVIDGDETADFSPLAEKRDGVYCGRHCFFIRSRGLAQAHIMFPGLYAKGVPVSNIKP